MAAADASRFAPRPVIDVLDGLADALEWPRTRPARMLAGDRAQLVSRVALCTSQASLLELDEPHALALCAVEPGGGVLQRAGRRSYDPFVSAEDATGEAPSWQRAARVVLDASLLVAGGFGGVDEQLAERCGLVADDGGKLAPVRSVDRDVCKLVAYVPDDAAEQVRDALFAAGAGTIGAYDMCSWSTSGTGTFRGGEGTNPTIGERGALERVAEQRIEVVVPGHLVGAVVRAYVRAHPYEEPAFDVLPMCIPARVGFGRYGRIPAGGGAAIWTMLGELDPELVVHGRADHVAAGAGCVIHLGTLRHMLAQVLERDDVQLVVVADASPAELDLLAERGVAVMLMDATRALDACAGSIAARLSRALTMPVTVAGALRFPGESDLDARLDGAASWGSSGGARGDSVREPATADAATGSSASPSSGTWRLHFDGGSRGNPGPAAYGWVLYDPDGREAAVDGVRVGRATNNVAEWTGLLRGLEHAAELGVRRLDVRGDSELVVKQVTGVYRVKNEALKPIASQVKDVMRRFETVGVSHVYRSDNARADELANEAMDGLR